MAGRRGNREESLYQRSADGLWCGFALLGYEVRGRMIRKTVTAKSRTEVTRKLVQPTGNDFTVAAQVCPRLDERAR